MKPGLFKRQPDDEFNDVEHRVRSALAARADSVEPSDDAFLRITEAVASSTPGGWKRWLLPGFVGSSGSLWSPVAFVTAVVAVAFGLTVTLFPSDREANVAAIGPATPDLSEIVPGEDDSTSPLDDGEGDDADDDTESEAMSGLVADEQIDTDVPDTEAVGESAAANSPGLATTASTLPESNGYAPVRTASADALSSLIRSLALDDLNGLARRVESDRVFLVGSDETADLARVDFERVQDAFAVAEISSDAVEMELSGSEASRRQPDVTVGDEDQAEGEGGRSASGDDVVEFDEQVVVTIEADAAVRSIVVNVVDALSGRSLGGSEQALDDGGTEPWTFATTISLPGSSRAWVVATGRSAQGEIVGVHAQPIRFDGITDPANYTVVRLRRFDPDGGLVVRDAPAGSRVGLLEIGTSGIRRTAQIAELADGIVWWSVVADDGTEGWVASEFLMAVPDLSEASLVRWAQSVLVPEPVGNPPLITRDEVALFGDRLVMGDALSPIDAERHLTPGHLLVPFAWNRGRDLLSGEASSFADFYRTADWQTSNLQVGANPVVNAVARENRAQFGALPSFVVPIGEMPGQVDTKETDGEVVAGEPPVGQPAVVPTPASGQVRFHVADGALPGQPIRPIIVGITLESIEELGGGTPEDSDGSAGDTTVNGSSGDDGPSSDSDGNDIDENSGDDSSDDGVLDDDAGSSSEGDEP